jgi:hypothetical protein
MLDIELQNRGYAYAVYAAAIATLVSGILLRNAYLLAAEALLLLCSVAYLNSGHIINNLVLRKGKAIEVCMGYGLSEDLRSMVKASGNAYIAVSCIAVRSNGAERNGELLSSLVRNTDFPFEFSLGMEAINQGKVLDRLEEKRRLKEIEISRCDAKRYDRMNVLRRELGVIESEIRGIRGQKMLAMRLKLKTFCTAGSSFEAARTSASNAEKLSSAFSSALGFECETLKGERLFDEVMTNGV